MRFVPFIMYVPGRVAYPVAYRTWEQEVAGSIPGPANILSEY